MGPCGRALRALSLTPPYGSLIAVGAKRIETRSWGTAYRGALAIHQTRGLAGMRVVDLVALCARAPFRAALGGPDADPAALAAGLPRGAVVAVARLVACMRMGTAGIPAAAAVWFQDDPTWDPAREVAFGTYAPGRWAWVLAGVRLCVPPIAARGALGVWRWAGPAGCG